MKRWDVLRLQGLSVQCALGIYPDERVRTQRVELDLALSMDSRAAARGADLGATVNYARLAAELRFLLESCRFGLIETAAEALCAYVLAPPLPGQRRAQVEEVTLKVTKPEANTGGGVPSIELHRERGAFTYGREEQAFGLVDVVHEAAGHGIYRLRIAPGKSIATHLHRALEESELILTDGLLLQRKPIQAGAQVRWAHGVAHRYDNPTQAEQTVLCVDVPKFDPADEVYLDDPPEGFPAAAIQHRYPEQESA